MIASPRVWTVTRSVLAASLLVAGCGFFGKVLGKNDGQAGATGSSSHDAAQAEQDQALQQRVEALWAEIDAEGITSARALALADLTFEAHRSGAVQRGHVNGPGLARATLGHLEDALAAEPAAAADLQLAAGSVHLLLQQPDQALAAYNASIAAQPRMEPFWALQALPPGPAVSEAVLAACPVVRPVVPGTELADFVAACLVAAEGNANQLQWDGIQGDLVAHAEEMARRAEEQRRLEEEERRRAEEEAAAAAQQARYQVAAVFAAGSCSFGDCMHKGWEIRTDDGTVRVSCNFGDCLGNGWEAHFPDGGTARTSCNFGDCMQKGWETRFPDGQTARTSCSFGECATKGWETQLPDGGTARTSCNFGECYTKGWETRLPDGGSVRCNCNFGDCLQNGTDCG
ncbi:MAG: hypothetical protein KDK70_25940 [Myxococcales bacterium]|nr:hypothetical protein [Myxococcales bacterium]